MLANLLGEIGKTFVGFGRDNHQERLGSFRTGRLEFAAIADLAHHGLFYTWAVK